MDPEHGLHLRSRSATSVVPRDSAFLPNVTVTDDELAEALGEGAVSSMTSGEYQRLSSSPLDEDDLSVVHASEEARFDEPDFDEALDAESDEPASRQKEK